jgi:asparaginyl-tRNA synthetase
MIEPEVAFSELSDNMLLAEEFLKHICSYILEKCPEDLNFLQDREREEQRSLPQNKRQPLPLLERINFVVKEEFEKITYTEAINLLKSSKKYKNGQFNFPVEWGTDLQSEHERYLVEEHFKKPVIIIDYPASFKAFYMRLNEDQQTVAAMDVLFPSIGEIMGGSQREERYEVLVQKCKEMNIPTENIEWYLDTRRYGTCKHSGFGLGFERLIMFLTGMTNIRDVIPFPRTPKNAKF